MPAAALPVAPATAATTISPTTTAQRPDVASIRHTPAEWLSFPTDPLVVSVEHPALIANIDNGIRSLGGEHHIKHVGRLFFRFCSP